MHKPSATLAATGLHDTFMTLLSSRLSAPGYRERRHYRQTGADWKNKQMHVRPSIVDGDIGDYHVYK
jgi:hypothetical protein